MTLPEGAALIRIADNHSFLPFDCGDNDLNDFLINDSIPHLKKLLAVTYVIQSNTETICFFSLLNDKVTINDLGKDEKEERKKWKTIFSGKTGKPYSSHPAIKIGRLGVTNTYKGMKVGSTVINYLKELFITNNRTGCRFITVDAYTDSLSFYEKAGFKYMTEKDVHSRHTRHMYFDLISLC